MKAEDQLKDTAIRQAMEYLQGAYAGRARLEKFIDTLNRNRNASKMFKLEHEYTGGSPAGNWTNTLALPDMPFECVHGSENIFAGALRRSNCRAESKTKRVVGGRLKQRRTTWKK